MSQQSPPRKSARKPVRPDRRSTPDRLYIYGLHPVEAALANPRRKIHSALVTENAAKRLSDRGAVLPTSRRIVQPREIDRLLPKDAVHQGCVIEVAPLPALSESDLSAMALIVVLDQITDPHNVGAIMRSAVAFGADALITTRRHSPVESGVLAKSASGALEMLHHLSVGNLARFLGTLDDAGFQTIGLDSEGASPIEDLAFGSKVALVLGAEGKGLRQGTRAACQHLARLDMPGEIKSLNVSNAAALALYVAHQAIRG